MTPKFLFLFNHGFPRAAPPQQDLTTNEHQWTLTTAAISCRFEAKRGTLTSDEFRSLREQLAALLKLDV
jgi:hypothetical protein